MLSDKRIDHDRLTFFLFFLTLGAVSSIFQLIFAREVMGSFRGNELFLGFFLSIWLLATGIGSLAGNRFGSKFRKAALGYYFLTVSLAAGIFYLLLNLFPVILDYSYTAPSLAASLALMPAVFLPLGLALGAGFAWGTNIFKPDRDTELPRSVNLAYLLETAGFFIGCLFFSFILVKISSFILIPCLALFGLALDAVIIIRQNGSAKILAWLVHAMFAAAIILLLSGAFGPVKNIIEGFKFKNDEYIAGINTHYGQLAVTRRQGQFNIYEQGSLLALSDNLQFNEEFIHAPIQFVENPKKILLAGSAWNGQLREALKYPDLTVSYAEADSELLPSIRNYLEPAEEKVLDSTRVIHADTDAMLYLTETGDKYDMILIDLPPPANYQLNRYYTEEFFRLAKAKLNREGAFAFALPYGENKLSRGELDLINSVFGAFSAAFPANLLLPGQKLIFLGLNSESAVVNAVELAQRFKQRDIAVDFLSPANLLYLVKNERRQEIMDEIVIDSHKINTNLTPIGLVLEARRGAEKSNPAAASIINQVIELRYYLLAGLIILPLFLFFFFYRSKSWQKYALNSVALFLSSLALIFEVLLIFLWQMRFGNIYYEISLLAGLVMLGVFLANLQIYLRPFGNKQGALKIYILAAFIFSLISFLFVLLEGRTSFLSSQILIYAFALASGYLAGAIYPLANAIYLERGSARSTGYVYGLELAGGCLLTMVFSLFVLPFLGLPYFAGLIVFVVLVCSLIYRKGEFSP